MPAVSKAQQRFMGMCEHTPGKQGCPDMPQEKMHEFAATSTKGLPYKKKKPGLKDKMVG